MVSIISLGSPLCDSRRRGCALKYISSLTLSRLRHRIERYESRGAMPRYCLKAPIAAIYDRPEGGLVRVTLPAGAILTESSQHSSTLLGLVGVLWEGRNYSVSLNDLLHKGENVKTA